MFRRRGGLVRAAATTAVVAGTAGRRPAPPGSEVRRAGSGAVRRADGSAAGRARRRPLPAQPDYAAELEQLAQLKAQGILTEEEFEAKKKQILGI